MIVILHLVDNFRLVLWNLGLTKLWQLPVKVVILIWVLAIIIFELIANESLQVCQDLLLEVMRRRVLPLVSHGVWVCESKFMHNLVVVLLFIIMDWCSILIVAFKLLLFVDNLISILVLLLEQTIWYSIEVVWEGLVKLLPHRLWINHLVWLCSGLLLNLWSEALRIEG